MTRPLRKIVVGTSLDLASDRVLKAALELRRKTGAELHLVHGYPLPVVYGGGIYAIHTQIEVDEIHDRALVDAQLKRVGAKAEDFAKIVVLLDNGDHLINQVADQIDADLIVVGASETAPSLQPFLGSTADRLLRRSTRPVLVVRGEFTPHHVLAPTDLSELSESACARGIALVDQLAGPDHPPKVDALFVLSLIDREGSAHFKPEQVDRFASEELDAFLGRLPQRQGGETKPVLRNGHPRDEVLAYVAAHADIDLVLLGTHGRRGFERFLLGSVAAELIRRLNVSALVMPPETKENG